MIRILAVGAAAQDVFLSQSPALVPVCEAPDKCFERLELGGKADVNKIDFSTGGGATNAATTFARAGLHASYMGAIGRDPAGIAVLDDLDREGVDTTHVKYNEHYNTGYSVILLAPTGERTILTYRGASTHYHKNAFDMTGVTADWVYISSLAGKMDVLDHVVTQAKKKGIKVMLNPGKGELKHGDKLKALLDDIDVLLVNRDEMQTIIPVEDMHEQVLRARHLVPVVIVSDGPNGVCASDGKTIVRAGMYEDVPVVDRTGAGDAFGSGFLSQWAQGKSLKHCITYASANSTSVVTKIGAKTGIIYGNTKLHDMDITEEEV